MYQVRAEVAISNGSVSLQDINSATIMTTAAAQPIDNVLSSSLSTGSVANAHRKRASFFVDKLACLKKYEPMTRLTRLIVKHGYSTSANSEADHKIVDHCYSKITTTSENINRINGPRTQDQLPNKQQDRMNNNSSNKANIKVSSCSTSSSVSTTVSMDSLASNQSSVLTNYATNSTSSTHSITTAANYYLPPFKLKIKLNQRQADHTNGHLGSVRKLSATPQTTLAVDNSLRSLNHSSSANDIERIGEPPAMPNKDRISDKSCNTSNHESDDSMKQSTSSLSKVSDSSKKSSTKSKSGKKSKRQENLNQLNKLVEYLHRDIQPKLLSLEAEELELAQSYKRHSTKLCDYCLNHANLEDLLSNQPGFRSSSTMINSAATRSNMRSERSPTRDTVTAPVNRANSPPIETMDPSEQIIKCYNCNCPIVVGNHSYPATTDHSPSAPTVTVHESTVASSPELHRPSSKSPHNIASWIDNEITSLINEFESKKRLSS
ncbi:hypothetical protein GZH46_00829 [Fragariocoptes setiger]|uniref:Uncharacterized protein n=1 Tax=Fragariocoptes setiger TaxID=1670756 RepID=A0ABQ7SB52_9ACAR|nr:hypothetical protein GZH46_00829 [Fragariocoptes setiger]